MNSDKVYSYGCLYYQHHLCKGVALTLQGNACCCACHRGGNR